MHWIIRKGVAHCFVSVFFCLGIMQKIKRVKLLVCWWRYCYNIVLFIVLVSGAFICISFECVNCLYATEVFVYIGLSTCFFNHTDIISNSNVCSWISLHLTSLDYDSYRIASTYDDGKTQMGRLRSTVVQYHHMIFEKSDGCRWILVLYYTERCWKAKLLKCLYYMNTSTICHKCARKLSSLIINIVGIYYAPAPRVEGIKRWCASDVCLMSVCREHRA